MEEGELSSWGPAHRALPRYKATGKGKGNREQEGESAVRQQWSRKQTKRMRIGEQGMSNTLRVWVRDYNTRNENNNTHKKYVLK